MTDIEKLMYEYFEGKNHLGLLKLERRSLHTNTNGCEQFDNVQGECFRQEEIRDDISNYCEYCKTSTEITIAIKKQAGVNSGKLASVRSKLKHINLTNLNRVQNERK